jgi:hypothetical protein
VSCNEHITSKDAQKIKFVQDGVNLLTAIVHVKPKLKPLLQPIIDIGTVFLSSLTAPPDPSCPGKQVLGLITSGVNVADAVILSQDPDDAPGIPAVTGTIMVVKKIASNYDEMGAGESQFLIPQEDTTFDFTGEGLGIDQAFSIITNQCNGSCDAAGRQGSKTFAGLTTDGGLRTITEHPPVPNAPDPDGDDDAQWYTKNVTCTSSLGESGTIPNITQGTPGSISDRSGSFSVTNLKANEILICTFENGIFEIEFN